MFAALAHVADLEGCGPGEFLLDVEVPVQVRGESR